MMSLPLYVQGAWFAGALLFIFGLKGMSSPASARKGIVIAGEIDGTAGNCCGERHQIRASATLNRFNIGKCYGISFALHLETVITAGKIEGIGVRLGQDDEITLRSAGYTTQIIYSFGCARHNRAGFRHVIRPLFHVCLAGC